MLLNTPMLLRQCYLSLESATLDLQQDPARISNTRPAAIHSVRALLSPSWRGEGAGRAVDLDLLGRGSHNIFVDLLGRGSHNIFVDLLARGSHNIFVDLLHQCMAVGQTAPTLYESSSSYRFPFLVQQGVLLFDRFLCAALYFSRVLGPCDL